MDALNAIKERRGKLELVITNVERTDTNRFGIIEYIEKEFKLRVALMRPDGNLKILSRGIESGVTVYMVKCSSITDIKNLWENALARERGKMVAKEVDSCQRESLLENSSNSAVSERTRVYRKRRRNENGETSEQDDSKDDSKTEKKARVQWSDEMHRKFLEAIAQLGLERAFPKKIVEFMNIPGLTREHVASHLQKHRMNLRKAQETLADSFYGRTSINDVKYPCFPSSHSQPVSFDFQQGSRETLSVPASYCCSFNPEASTSKSRIRPAQSFSVNNQGKLQFLYTKQNFRVYGDQTKNVLLGLENSRSSSNANQSAASSNVNTGFVGLRLTDDGKSVEIGQTGILGGFGINRVLSSPSGIYGIQNSFQYPLSFDNDPNEDFEQCPSPSSFKPQQQSSLLPLEINGNENSKQFPLLPVSFSPDQQSLQQLGCIANENSDQYPFSSMPPLMTNVGENLDHCPLVPVSFTTPQQCSLHEIESSDHYPSQHYPPMRFEEQGNDSSDIDHLTFVECTTADPPSLKEPSISIPDEEASMPPLQLHELDCFGVSEYIEVLVGNTARNFCEEDFANILFSHED